MGNGPLHRSDRIEWMYSAARVKVCHLPPYSPDVNPIGEFSPELNALITKKWEVYERRIQTKISRYF
ncbi:hypothetical protein PV08_03119 [Exophiala spinifera]|uniref:Tc1-like transposase DDE domain-containing protein n=1 Tax=Exophiala spinifera TaxID=91928 RepID=A0A0D2BJQ8_9EURO|nr:uncharacterized protein PV08_03119 [Exophiala spinifera]KIW18830.1 hypothetical protein PV08_03119 [Exophiala spinifera]